jgi:ATP-dependent protease HslVU (ClpYQ) peptidase subunit
MTTIAVSKSQIAGDRQATHAGGLKFRLKTKIFEFNQPILYDKPIYVGLAGNVESFADVLAWFSDPTQYKTPPALKGGEGVILAKDGKIFTFFKSPANWTVIDQNTYAIGSGSHFAMGAMAAGASPIDAVKEAIKLDPSTGMGTTFYNV